MSIEIINLTPYKKQPVPEVGKEYHIFDDGKVRLSRHSICRICKVIPFDECNDLELLEAWNDEVLRAHWLFSTETDYFVNGAVKKEELTYDEAMESILKEDSITASCIREEIEEIKRETGTADFKVAFQFISFFEDFLGIKKLSF